MSLQPALTCGNKKFVVYLMGQDILIMDEHDVCVASSNPERVGSKIATLATPGQPAKEFQSSIDQFISKLVNNKIDPLILPLYETEAKAMGLNLDLRRSAILLLINDFEKNISSKQTGVEADEVIQNFKKSIAFAFKNFFTKNHDIIVAYIGGNKFIIFKAVGLGEEENFRKYLRQSHQSIFEPVKNSLDGNVLVGLGDAYSGVKGLVESFKEANSALELGRRIGEQSENFFYFGDLKEIRILIEEDNQKKVIYSKDILKKLGIYRNLERTLEVFFERNLSLTETASRLKIHPNTVIYRLGKIKKILGLDPKVFNQAITIKMAMLATKLLANQ